MVLPTAVDKLGEGGNHFQIKNSLISMHVGTFLKDSGHFQFVALEPTQLFQLIRLMTCLGIVQVFQSCTNVRHWTSSIN